MPNRICRGAFPLLISLVAAGCADPTAPFSLDPPRPVFSSAATSTGGAAERVTLGSHRFVRTTGQPYTVVHTVSVVAPGDFDEVRLSARGERSSIGQPLTRAEVRFNGRLIWSGTQLLNAGTLFLPVTIGASNTISVQLWGAPGSAVVVELTAKQKRLTWRQLASDNSGPQSNNSGLHNSAIYLPEQDAILVVATPGDYRSGELWRFSLASHQWTQLPSDNWPSGKFRDYVLDPIRNEVVVAWDGIGEIWAIPVAGGRWYQRHAAPNWESHYIGSFFYDRDRDRLSHLFGYGLGTYRADYHYFADGAWRTAGVGGDPVWPRVPYCSLVALNSAGTAAFYSGGGGDANPAQQEPEPQYDDLLRFDLRTQTVTYLAPRRHRAGIDRACSALALVDDEVYRWGGLVYRTDDDRSYLADPTDELQRFESGSWRTIATENRPPALWHRTMMFHDPRRGDLVTVGGWNGTRWVFSIHAIRIE